MPISDHKPVPGTPDSGLLGSTSLANSVSSGDAYVEATHCAGELLQHYDGAAPTYSQIKSALYSGRIPGWKLANGHWVLPRASRDAIAAAFGMSPKVAGRNTAPRAAEHPERWSPGDTVSAQSDEHASA